MVKDQLVEKINKLRLVEKMKELQSTLQKLRASIQSIKGTKGNHGPGPQN